MTTRLLVFFKSRSVGGEGDVARGRSLFTVCPDLEMQVRGVGTLGKGCLANCSDDGTHCYGFAYLDILGKLVCEVLPCQNMKEAVELENGGIVKSFHGGLYNNSVWYSAYGSNGRMESAREDAKCGDIHKIYVSADEYSGDSPQIKI